MSITRCFWIDISFRSSRENYQEPVHMALGLSPMFGFSVYGKKGVDLHYDDLQGLEEAIKKIFSDADW